MACPNCGSEKLKPCKNWWPYYFCEDCGRAPIGKWWKEKFLTPRSPFSYKLPS
jgi:hypothetical protein